MARLTGPNYVSAVKVDLAERAEDYRSAGQRASKRLMAKHAALGELYGDAAALVLIRAAEDVEENLAEAACAWRELADVRERTLIDQAKEAGHLRSVVLDTAAEIQRRYGKRLPDELRPIVEAAGDIWPYLYPPDDERHEHMTNAGGACRHPLCRYLSDNDPDQDWEAPF